MNDDLTMNQTRQWDLRPQEAALRWLGKFEAALVSGDAGRIVAECVGR